jgi:GDP-4-dehydro-6-deoxy-D-mannose reductase
VRIWVSGAKGFVGTHLVPRLEAEGHAVLAPDREVDVRDPRAVARSLERDRPDAVVHLAALASVAGSLDEPALTSRTNTFGTLHVLRAVARCVPRARVLLVSSGEIYGTAADGPFVETAPLRPATPYARSKAAADLLGAGFAARGLDVVRARPFSHTGPGQDDRYVASSFARQLAEIESGRRPPVLRVGNLDAVRDLLDVSDVVEAYCRLLDPRAESGVYNVARGSGVAVREILDALRALSSAKPETHVDPALWRPATVSVGSAERLRRATGWTPRVSVRDTLARVLGHWREQVKGSR